MRNSEYVKPRTRPVGFLLIVHWCDADCLSRNGFDEAKCTRLVDALYECCNAFYTRHGDDGTTVSCPKAHLLRLKMEQRRKGTS